MAGEEKEENGSDGLENELSMKDIKIVEEAKKPLSMHPKKFALWLFQVSVVMIFGGLTSALIVRRGDGNWMYFELPTLFWISTVIILVSSATMHWAYLAARRDNIGSAKLAMILTLLLGIGFLVSQVMAYDYLVGQGIHFVNSTAAHISGSFVYVLSGLHGLHIVSAVIVVAVTTVSVFRYRIHSKNMTSMEMCMTYWHFLDVLWLYLFVFLLLNR